jgi:ParB family chromosome partitioning protein
MSKKWHDPIDKLLEADHKSRNVKEYIEDNLVITKINNNENAIISLDPNKISLWKYKDRPANELGDIDLLAKKMKDIGQQQPCIVRPSGINKDYYELIAGERRWRASIKASINLKVIVKNLTDNEAAIVQDEENYHNPLSEFAQGMSYANQIKDGILKQVDLIDKIGITKQKLSRLLSFSQIPTDVSSAIGDLRKVSSGTAEKIKQLCSKGEEYKNCIIELSEKIRSGKLGHEKLSKIIEEKLYSIPKIKVKNIYDNEGILLFKIKKSRTNDIIINIKSDIICSLKGKLLNNQFISDKIMEVLQDDEN